MCLNILLTNAISVDTKLLLTLALKDTGEGGGESIYPIPQGRGLQNQRMNNYFYGLR